MKAMVCEMCNSNEIVKQDGMFVCQHCGTKYSVEEARKMMIDGTVDVQGTVKVDDSAKIDNYYRLAQNAYDAENTKEAEEYCNKILEIDPNNSDAHLLKGMAAGWQSTLAKSRIDEFLQCYKNAMSSEDDEDKMWEIACTAYHELYHLELANMDLLLNHIEKFCDKNDVNKLSNMCMKALMDLTTIQLVFGTKYNEIHKEESEEKVTPPSVAKNFGYNDIFLEYKSKLHTTASRLFDTSWREYNNSGDSDGFPTKYDCEKANKSMGVAWVLESLCIPAESTLEKIKESKEIDIVKRACRKQIDICSKYMNIKGYEVSFSGGIKAHNVTNSLTLEFKQGLTNDIRKCHRIIKYFEPSYEIPEVAEPKAKSGGCYVATAVYGSYDCPEVWTLRRYRDDTLASTWYGRAFIKTYYATSPTLVKWFGNTEWFKNMWKPTLDKMVAKLNGKGVEDTPYNDKQW